MTDARGPTLASNPVLRAWMLVHRAWEFVRSRAQALLPCRFSILVLVVVFAAFTMSQQGVETLRVVAEYGTRKTAPPGPGFWFRLGMFFFAVTVFSTQLWYCSRHALNFEVPTAPPPEDIRRWTKWTPRLLGVLGFLAPAAGLFVAGASLRGSEAPQSTMLLIAAGLILESGAFLLFVSRRRSWFRLARRSDAFESRVRTFRELPPSTRLVLLFTGGLALLLFLIVFAAPVRFSQGISAPSVLLLCASIWVLAGAVLLYFARSWRIPVISMFLLLALVASPWTDNHVVEPARRVEKLRRVTLIQALRQRQDALDRDFGPFEHPLYVVAAEGGGIRAAYWTAVVLSRIQDMSPSFAAHCFAISGVSGGSLGAAVFTALVDPNRKDYRGASSQILASDFLSPVLARMFGADLPNQFFPGVRLPDRGRGLEMAWEDAWRTQRPFTFHDPFLRLSRAPDRPLLFLNGTWAETGRRIIFSPVRIDSQFENALDGYLRMGGDIPVSTAVHMSARFTYVSPAASILASDGRVSLHVVDGGYFEDSGAATASDIWTAIRRARLERLRPRVLFIRYSEENTGDQRDRKGSQRSADSEKPRRFLSEELSPIRAMLGARTARGQFAIDELKKKSGAAWLEFVLSPESDTPLPLGWLLSAAARDSIDTGLKRGANPTNLEWIRQDLAPPVGPIQKPEDKVAADAEASRAARKRDGLLRAIRQPAKAR